MGWRCAAPSWLSCSMPSSVGSNSMRPVVFEEGVAHEPEADVVLAVVGQVRADLMLPGVTGAGDIAAQIARERYSHGASVTEACRQARRFHLDVPLVVGVPEAGCVVAVFAHQAAAGRPCLAQTRSCTIIAAAAEPAVQRTTRPTAGSQPWRWQRSFHSRPRTRSSTA